MKKFLSSEFKSMIEKIKNIFLSILEKRRIKQRLKELRKRDPFIYK
jgi:hypothetical protein